MYLPVIPDTKDLSRMPSFLSASIAPDVNATAKKKMILENVKHSKVGRCLFFIFRLVFLFYFG